MGQGLENLGGNLRLATIRQANPTWVRVDGDRNDARAQLAVPASSITVGERCVVTNIGGRLTVVSISTALVPCEVDPSRVPGGIAPSSDNVKMTAGQFDMPFDGVDHYIAFDESTFPNGIISLVVTPCEADRRIWITLTDPLKSLLAVTTYAEVAVTVPVPVSFMATGW